VPHLTRPLRVLCVDDDAVARELMQGACRAAGADVRCAGDGAAALREARAFRPDLVLLDVVMPVLDGLSACRMLRGDPELCGVAIHVVSSRTTPADRDAALRVGASGFLAKPFSVAALVALVGRIALAGA